MTRAYYAIEGAITSEYGSKGSTYDVDCLAGFSPGSIPKGGGHSPIDIELAKYMIAEQKRHRLFTPDRPNLTIIAQAAIVRAITDIDEGFANNETIHVIPEDPSAGLHGGLNPYKALSAAHECMIENGLKKPILIGHARLANMIAAQAYKLGIEDYAVTGGLPDTFDLESTQLFARNQDLFTLAAVPNILYSWLIKGQM